MALVSITEAAKLVRRNRTTVYRDIERGRLSKTVSPEGETRIDTSELLRVYGRLHDAGNDSDYNNDKLQIALLEEKNRSLERALTLEAELRRVKDQVTQELRARLHDKDNVIKVLESKLLFLEYDRQVAAADTQQAQQEQGVGVAPQKAATPDQSAQDTISATGTTRERTENSIGPAPTRWWRRLFGRN